jgi:hypothetical protein
VILFEETDILLNLVDAICDGESVTKYVTGRAPLEEMRNYQLKTRFFIIFMLLLFSTCCLAAFPWPTRIWAKPARSAAEIVSADMKAGA